MYKDDHYSNDLVNLVRGQYSKRFFANGANDVSHFDKAPIWQTVSGSDQGISLRFDLGLRFPISQICLHMEDIGNAIASFDPLISFSDDSVSWSTIKNTADKRLEKSVLYLDFASGSANWTQYVEIAIHNTALETIQDITIWCKQSQFDIIVFRKLTGASFDVINENADKDIYRSYNFLQSGELQSRSLVGVAPYENGAFGNCLIQYILAIGIAKNLNLKYVKLPLQDRSEVISLVEPIVCEGLTFIPGSHELPPDGYFLSGMFFDIPIQKLAGVLGQPETRQIVNSCIRPLFNKLPRHFARKPDDELLIHIRSGDIFSTWVAPHYPQPPLAFYQLVIQRLVAEKRIASIKLVFENRLNPVIACLESYILSIGISMSTQSGTLVDDVEALLNGPYLVFGLGTFGPAICQLSDRVEQVFYFASGWPQHFKGIGTIGKIVEIIDVGGTYTKVGEWDNSIERRQMMIDYPIGNLDFDDNV